MYVYYTHGLRVPAKRGMQPRLLFDTFVPYGYPRVVIVGQLLSSSFILFIYLFIYFARPKRDFFIETREIETKKKKKKTS